MKENCSETCQIPKLFVFDLDDTVWGPELDFYMKKPVGYLKDIQEILIELHKGESFKNSKLAVASSSGVPKRGQKKLKEMNLSDDLVLEDVFSFIEIYRRDKDRHFHALNKKTGIDYCDMIFYDNQMNNHEIVKKLGVTCVFTPDGLDKKLFQKSLGNFPSKDGKIIV